MEWGTLIRELMGFGFTQEAIARGCGCSQTAISLLYTGKRKNVKFETGTALISFYEKAKRDHENN